MPYYFLRGFPKLLIGVCSLLYLNTLASAFAPDHTDAQIIDTQIFSAQSFESAVSDGNAFAGSPTTVKDNNAGYSGQTAAETPDAPEFSHPAGTFTDPFNLHLSAGADTEIYYTTDGSTPGLSSTRYSDGNPIPINGTRIIRARAFRVNGDEGTGGDSGSSGGSDSGGGGGFSGSGGSGGSDSGGVRGTSEPVPGPVSTKIYSRLHPDVADFSSDLPLVIVHQFDNVMHPRGDYRSTVYFSVIDREEDGRARLLSNDLHLHSRSESNYRGSSSLQFPKKQFGVRLIDDDGENRNEPILGMPSENNWIMYAPYDDKTLMRNAIAYQLSSDMGRYAPRTRFVELFLHDGDGPLTSSHYHGVYMLVERIKWDNNRVNITKIGPTDNAEPEITGGYIINYDRDVHFRSTNRNTGFALVRPQHEDITPQQRNWIAQHIGNLETALFGNNFRDPDTGYAAWLDPESFIDHHLITEALKEIDGYRLSTFLHKDRGGRLVMGPVWDFNISLGNGNYLQAWQPHGWYYPLINREQYLNGWYTRLFQDPDFAEQYRLRWWELRQGPFSTEHITNMIRHYADLLDEAQERNFQRWNILGNYVWPNHFIGDTYEDEIAYMTWWIGERLEWIDSQMGTPPDNITPPLRHFWYFGDEMVNNTPLETIEASYSLVDAARIRFHSALEGYPFEEGHPNWRKASMERRNRPTDKNYHPEGNDGRPFDANRMRALQVRQPFTGDGGENTLIFEVPTTGMDKVVFRFAAMDEGAADAMLIDYSLDGDGSNSQSGNTLSADRSETFEDANVTEATWTTDGLDKHRHTLEPTFRLYQVDFSEIEAARDNPDFRIRIRFDGDPAQLAADDGNRVTFNNFSIGSTAEPIHDTSAGRDEHGNGYHSRETPDRFQLLQNYPNPFNPSTIIPFSVPGEGRVRLEVFDITGSSVATLTDRRYESGFHQVRLDASGLASGVYLVRAIMVMDDGRTVQDSQTIALVR